LINTAKGYETAVKMGERIGDASLTQYLVGYDVILKQNPYTHTKSIFGHKVRKNYPELFY
jgi:hypothetical protein